MFYCVLSGMSVCVKTTFVWKVSMRPITKSLWYRNWNPNWPTGSYSYTEQHHYFKCIHVQCINICIYVIVDRVDSVCYRCCWCVYIETTRHQLHFYIMCVYRCVFICARLKLSHWKLCTSLCIYIYMLVIHI